MEDFAFSSSKYYISPPFVGEMLLPALTGAATAASTMYLPFSFLFPPPIDGDLLYELSCFGSLLSYKERFQSDFSRARPIPGWSCRPKSPADVFAEMFRSSSLIPDGHFFRFNLPGLFPDAASFEARSANCRWRLSRWAHMRTDLCDSVLFLLPLLTSDEVFPNVDGIRSEVETFTTRFSVRRRSQGV